MKAHLITLLASAAIAVTVVACDSTPDYSPPDQTLTQRDIAYVDCVERISEGASWRRRIFEGSGAWLMAFSIYCTDATRGVSNAPRVN